MGNGDEGVYYVRVRGDIRLPCKSLMSKNTESPNRKQVRHAQAVARLYPSHLEKKFNVDSERGKKRWAYHPSNPPGGHFFPMSTTTNSILHRTKHTASTAMAHFNLFLPAFHLASNAKPTKILLRFGALCRLPSLPPDLPLLVPSQLECSSSL